MTSSRPIVLFALFAALGACTTGEMSPAGPRMDEPEAAPLTWHGDLAPVVFRECAGCHREGGIAPFSLLDYETARALGPLLARVTAERTMPPMPVNNDGSCHEFANARWLSDDEIALFDRWVSDGMVEGDPGDSPAVPELPPAMDEPDALLDMGVEYTPDASRDDDYRCFVVEADLAADAYVTAYQVVPSEPRVAHHAIVFALPDAEAEATVEALDARDEGPGYTCYGGVGVAGQTPLALWAPGTGITRYPEGTGLPIEAGRKLVLQMHYNLSAGPLPDRTTVRLEIAPTVDRPARFRSVANHDMVLPPRMEYVEASKEVSIPSVTGEIEVLGVLPHMHELGRTLRVERIGPDASSECMVDVDRWDFGWQAAWFYDTPAFVSGGDRIRITCGYDTLERSEPVTWGDGTADEMCLSYFYVVE